MERHSAAGPHADICLQFELLTQLYIKYERETCIGTSVSAGNSLLLRSPRRETQKKLLNGTNFSWVSNGV